jgi:hypothetical protein
MAKQEHIDAAKARYAEYFDLTIEAQRAGGGITAYETLHDYLGGGDINKYWMDMLLTYEQNGWHRTGEATIKSIVVTGYEGDPLDPASFETVEMDVCIDWRLYNLIGVDGESVGTNRVDTPVISRVVLRTQPSDDGRWTVNGDVELDPWQGC